MKTPLSLADALFSKTKKAVITTLFAKPERAWHLRELARFAKVSPTMLGKELDVLASVGIVLEREDGNRRLIQANPECPIYEELRGLARKTAGISERVRGALADIAGVRVAFIFGSVARGEEHSTSDVDVCVIGNASNHNITAALLPIEPEIGRPINPIVYTEHEFTAKVNRKNPFVRKLMASTKIYLVGGEVELARAAGQPGQNEVVESASTRGG